MFKREKLAVAIFGSTARNQADRISDRDLLIVGEKSSDLLNARQHAKRNGWSPTCYTWNRLSFSAAKGMLFIEHLKREANIRNDPHNRLRQTFDAFQVLPDYAATISEGHELISILSKIPSSIKGYYWALDVLAVGVRTIGIATLANEGIYSFSFYDILQNLEKLGILTSSDRHTLADLRLFKARYRGGNMVANLSWKRVVSLLDLINKRFRIGVDPAKASSSEIFERSEREMTNNWYRNSRLLEASIFGMRARSRYEDQFRQTKSVIATLVTQSGDYSWQLRGGVGRVTKIFREIEQAAEVI